MWANVLDSIQTLLAGSSAVTWQVASTGRATTRGFVDAQFTFSLLYIAPWLAQLASAGINQHRRRLLVFDALTSLPVFYQATSRTITVATDTAGSSSSQRCTCRCNGWLWFDLCASSGCSGGPHCAVALSSSAPT